MRLDTPTSEFRVIVSDNDSAPGSIEHIVGWCEDRVEVDRSGSAWSGLPKERRHRHDHRVIDLGAPGSFADAPLVTILRNGANLGFAGGNNTAIRLALTDPTVEAVWLLNNDTICRPDALDRLSERMRAEPDLGMLGSTLVYYDDPTKVQGLGGWFDGRKGMGDHIGKFTDLDALPSREAVEHEMTYVIGASMLVSRRFLEEVGLMEESYFLYFEETDWSERNAGRFRIGWEPASIVWHKEGGSIGTSLRHRASNTSLYFLNRNLLHFTRTYYPRSMPMIAVRILARAVRFLVRRDIDGARVVIRAGRDYLLGR
ncbi:glycosyltransferase family 2 protein [Siculibacillus lacustris]|nr:glycosyltransferase family 2 protein [Siculibacillus lacustris]